MTKLHKMHFVHVYSIIYLTSTLWINTNYFFWGVFLLSEMIIQQTGLTYSSPHISDYHCPYRWEIAGPKGMHFLPLSTVPQPPEERLEGS